MPNDTNQTRPIEEGRRYYNWQDGDVEIESEGEDEEEAE